MATFEFAATRGKFDLGTFRVDLDKLTPTQIAWLVNRGITESIRNSWASIKNEDPKCVELSLKAGLEWIERLERGEVIEGGRGGPRLSPYQKALRTVVAAWLATKHGMSPKDAAEAARDPHAIVKHYASIACEKTGSDLKVTIEKAMATFGAAAQKIVDASAPEETEI